MKSLGLHETRRRPHSKCRLVFCIEGDAQQLDIGGFPGEPDEDHVTAGRGLQGTLDGFFDRLGDVVDIEGSLVPPRREVADVGRSDQTNGEFVAQNGRA